MRTRREGGETSDVGFSGACQRLVFTNPVAIDRIEADLEVRDLAVSVCATNAAQPSRVIAVSSSTSSTTATGAPGNMTGDHLISSAPAAPRIRPTRMGFSSWSERSAMH